MTTLRLPLASALAILMALPLALEPAEGALRGPARTRCGRHDGRVYRVSNLPGR